VRSSCSSAVPQAAALYCALWLCRARLHLAALRPHAQRRAAASRRQMEAALNYLKQELGSMRTGRASPGRV